MYRENLNARWGLKRLTLSGSPTYPNVNTAEFQVTFLIPSLTLGTCRAMLHHMRAVSPSKVS